MTTTQPASSDLSVSLAQVVDAIDADVATGGQVRLVQRAILDWFLRGENARTAEAESEFDSPLPAPAERDLT